MIESISKETFHIATEHTSYVIGITATGHAEHIYYGRRLRDVRPSLTALRQKRYILPRSSTYVKEDDDAIDLTDSALEFTSEGKGDYKAPLIAASWG